LQVDDLRQKWNRIYTEANLPSPPCQVLRDYDFLLPETGTALDLACGIGGNAVYLAEKGLQTHAWDLSDVAINRLADYARQQGLPLVAENVDLQAGVFEHHSFDVITVSHYLDRSLIPELITSINENGLLFYQTFTIEAEAGMAPANPLYKLAINELLSLCAPLRVLVFMDTGRVGKISQGFRNESFLIAQKGANNDTRG